jgi:hypothetical protein
VEDWSSFDKASLLLFVKSKYRDGFLDLKKTTEGWIKV